MHLSMVSPRVGGGGATQGKLTQSAFPWAGILTQSWEFDMPASVGRPREPGDDLHCIRHLGIEKTSLSPGGWYSWEFLVPYSDQKVSFSRPGL